MNFREGQAEANVLQLDRLPAGWSDYDLIVSASMLEYVPRARFVDALAGLRALLREGGAFVLFMTRLTEHSQHTNRSVCTSMSGPDVRIHAGT